MKIEALRSSLLSTSSLTLLLLAVAGCDNPAEYQIPNTICGRDIEPSALEPLLPSGQKFEANQESFEENKSECVISVDDSTALRIDEYRDQNKFDIMENTRRYNNPAKSDVGEETLTSDDWLRSMNACPKRGKYYFLDVIVTGVAEAKPKELERFAQTYLPEGMKKMGCTQ